MDAFNEIYQAVKGFDELHQRIREFDEMYHGQLKELSKFSSMSLDADLARAQRIITTIRRDLEKAREET